MLTMGSTAGITLKHESAPEARISPKAQKLVEMSDRGKSRFTTTSGKGLGQVILYRRTEPLDDL